MSTFHAPTINTPSAKEPTEGRRRGAPPPLCWGGAEHPPFAGGVFIGSFAGGVGSFAGGATENLADVDMILEKNWGSAHKLFGEFAVKSSEIVN